MFSGMCFDNSGNPALYDTKCARQAKLGRNWSAWNISTGTSYILFSLAIKHITALESTFLGLIEPLLNPLWVFLTIGELPGPMSILGGIVVLAAVTIGCMKPKNPWRRSYFRSMDLMVETIKGLPAPLFVLRLSLS